MNRAHLCTFAEYLSTYASFGQFNRGILATPDFVPHRSGQAGIGVWVACCFDNVAFMSQAVSKPYIIAAPFMKSPSLTIACDQRKRRLVGFDALQYFFQLKKDEVHMLFGIYKPENPLYHPKNWDPQWSVQQILKFIGGSYSTI